MNRVSTKEIQARDRQIEEWRGDKVKFFSKKERGWIDVGGTRMCLLDIPGGWLNLGTSIILFAGEDTYRRVLFEAGLSETFSEKALKKGILDKTSKGFIDAVTTYSEAGFGDFVIKELLNKPNRLHFNNTKVGQEHKILI